MESKTKTKAKKAKSDPRRAYVVKVALKYPTTSGEVQAEPGDVVTELPARSVPWLLAEGYIAPADKEAADA